MESRTTRAGVALVLSMALLAAAGCSSGSSQNGENQAAGPSTTAKPQSGGKIVYGIEADPNGLDPIGNGWDPSGLLVAGAIYDPLAAFDAEGKAQPYLAESITPNSDFTEWTIKLRPNITFHNGEKLDAAGVVKFSDAVKASPIVGPALADVERHEVVDDLTMRTVMKRPWATYPVTLASQAGYVAAPKQLDDPDRSIHPVGTGPFQLREYEIDKKVRVTKNPNYWRAGLPYLEETEFRPIGDLQQRVEQLRGGTLNVIHSAEVRVNTKELDEDAKAGTIKVFHDKGVTDPNFLLLNTSQAPLDDVRIRRALAMGTDVGELAKLNGWPEDRVIPGIYPPGSQWYTKTDYPTYDPEQAKKLIREYESEKGKVSIQLGTTPDAESLRQIQTVGEQWRRLGVEVTGETVSFKDFVIRMVVGQFNAVLFRYYGQPDPDANWYYWTSQTTKPKGELSLNFPHLKDDQLDAAIDAGRQTTDVAKRKEAYAKAFKRFDELVPFIWLYRTDWAIATGKTVHDIENGPLPDGRPSLPMLGGVNRLTQTWIEQ